MKIIRTFFTSEGNGIFSIKDFIAVEVAGEILVPYKSCL